MIFRINTFGPSLGPHHSLSKVRKAIVCVFREYTNGTLFERSVCLSPLSSMLSTYWSNALLLTTAATSSTWPLVGGLTGVIQLNGRKRTPTQGSQNGQKLRRPSTLYSLQHRGILYISREIPAPLRKSNSSALPHSISTAHVPTIWI